MAATGRELSCSLHSYGPPVLHTNDSGEAVRAAAAGEDGRNGRVGADALNKQVGVCNWYMLLSCNCRRWLFILFIICWVRAAWLGEACVRVMFCFCFDDRCLWAALVRTQLAKQIPMLWWFFFFLEEQCCGGCYALASMRWMFFFLKSHWRDHAGHI